MRSNDINLNKRYRTIAVSALAALWLSACGGGGGDDPVAAAPTPTQPSAGAPAPAPGPAPAPAPGPAPAPAPAPLTWTAVSGLAANQYHTVASNDAGNVLVAGTITTTGGRLLLSSDSGASFAPTTAPAGSWISVDMTPTGQRIVGAQYGGGIYLSTNTGGAWTRIDGTTNREYESVTISEDGARVVAVTLSGAGGAIFTSSNANTATPTFTQATLVGGGALSDSFRWVDSSANGMMVVAASHNGTLYLSTNGGTTFSVLPVTVGGANVANGWYRVAISDDGNRIAVAGNTEYGSGVAAASRSTGLYVGNRNTTSGAWTWTRASAVSGEYTALSMTGNGGVIAATLSATTAPTAGPGQILLSSNGGQSFTARTAPAGETNWRSIALNATGSQAVLAAGEFLSTNGLLYVSSGTLVD
jgi:hypothetical protein